MDQESEVSLLQVKRFSGILINDCAAHSYPVIGHSVAAKLKQPVQRPQWAVERVVTTRLLDRNFPQAGNKHFDSHKLPVTVKDGSTNASDQHHGIHQMLIVSCIVENLDARQPLARV